MQNVISYLLFLKVNPWRIINPRFNLIFSRDFTILTLDLIYAKCHFLFLKVNPWCNINPRFNLDFFSWFYYINPRFNLCKMSSLISKCYYLIFKYQRHELII